MAYSLAPYYKAVRSTLQAAFCLRDLAPRSLAIPDIECKTNDDLLLQPLVVARTEQERCLIEGSLNSVRISFRFRAHDEMDSIVVSGFCRFLEKRAEDLVVLRRRAVKVCRSNGRA